MQDKVTYGFVGRRNTNDCEVKTNGNVAAQYLNKSRYKQACIFLSLRRLLVVPPLRILERRVIVLTMTIEGPLVARCT